MTTDNTSRNTPDRMDEPFVGLATFARQPACPDWDKLNGTDVAVLGIPIDTASSYRVGTRFGPRAIREVSMFHGFAARPTDAMWLLGRNGCRHVLPMN
jgi:agmatinase